jgi:hypothetical protein
VLKEIERTLSDGHSVAILDVLPRTDKVVVLGRDSNVFKDHHLVILEDQQLRSSDALPLDLTELADGLLIGAIEFVGFVRFYEPPKECGRKEEPYREKGSFQGDWRE